MSLWVKDSFGLSLKGGLVSQHIRQGTCLPRATSCNCQQKTMAEETDLGTAYTGQDDINDKLLLDLAWERQQKKVGKWGNFSV